MCTLSCEGNVSPDAQSQQQPGKSALAKAEGVPVQGIFAVFGSPQMLEVAKHDMRRPTAGPIPCLVG